MSTNRMLLGAIAAALLASAAQAQITPGESGLPPAPGDRPDPTTEQLPLPPASEPTSREQPPLDDEEADEAAENATNNAAAQERASDAADIIGVSVETPKGEAIGQVQNVVVDSSSGEPTHAIIAHGNGERGSSKFTAIPWARLDGLRHANVVVMERARLEDAPSFTEGTMPDLNSPDWSAASDRYWESVRTASSESEEDETERR